MAGAVRRGTGTWSARLAAALVVVWAGSGLAAEAGVAPAAPLRYTWKAGDRLAFAVELEMDEGDTIETRSGTVAFTVKEATNGRATVSMPALNLGSQRKAKPGKEGPGPLGLRPPVIPRIPRFGPPGMAFQGHELTLDARGAVLSERGESQLPYALGNLASLIFEPFPEKADPSWQRQERTAIRITSEFPHLSPFREEVEKGRHNAEETTTFTIESASPERVTVRREYSLRTVEKVQDRPLLEMEAKGTYTFDRARGLPGGLQYQVVFSEREGNREQRYPIRLSCRLLSDAEVKELEAKAAAAEAAHKAPPNPEQRQAWLADLRSGDENRQRTAVLGLLPKSPVQPDDEVAKALAGVLAQDDQPLRLIAAQALANWATPAAADALLTALDGTDGLTARAAAKALAKLQDKRAIGPLAAKMPDMAWRMDASATLKAIGPAAEDAVAKLLTHQDWGVRLEACRILTDTGTADSLKALDAAATGDANILVKQTAKSAADTIRGRARAP